MEQKALSIIIASANPAEKLKNTLGSINKQSFRDLELICVDVTAAGEVSSLVKDCSADGVEVTYISAPGKSTGAAWNEGLQAASGQYVLFADTESTFLNYALEAAMAKALKYNADCLRFCAIAYDETLSTTVENIPYQYSKFQNGDFNRALDFEKDEAVLKMNQDGWSALYRRNFLLENGILFDDTPFYYEKLFFAKILTLAQRHLVCRDRVLIHTVDVPDKAEKKQIDNLEYLAASTHQMNLWLRQIQCSDDFYKKFMDNELGQIMSIAGKYVSNLDFPEEKFRIITELIDTLDFALIYKYQLKVQDIQKKAETKRPLLENETNNSEKPVRKNKEKNFYYEKCEHPKVSVVVPTYNQEEYLNLALTSLSKQTLEEIEFLCVNDGSTDATMTILKEYAEIDKRIIIIDKPNSGYGQTMNVGIEAAKGEYIGILEPDDFILPDMFRSLYETASANNLDFVKSNFYRFWDNEDGSERKQLFRVGSKDYYDRVIKPLDEPVVFSFEMNTWSGIYKTSFLNAHHIRHNETPGASYQDNGFWFQTFMFAERAWFMDKAFYMNRRDNPNSSMFSKGKFYAVTNEYNFIWEILSNNPDKLKVLQPIFYRKKFYNFLTTYYRLAAEHKIDYLHHFRDEFKEPVEKGLLDLTELSDYHRNMLLQIINDPDSVYASIRVSVIIPAYNAEKYIRQCLDSILVRAELPMEVIIVDDGSTDNTLAILREYEAGDTRVKVITQENAGAGAARNNGMKFAHGEYLAFLDADDFFEPDMLRLAYESASANNTDVTVWKSDNYLEESRTFTELSYSIRSDLMPGNVPFAGTDVRQDIFKLFVGWPWDKLFRAEFVRENKLFFQEQRTTNDMLFVFSAIVKAKAISTVGKVLAHHRRAGDGKSLSVSREKSWDCFYHALTALRDQLKEWGLYKRFEKDFINYSLHFCLWNLNSIKGEAYGKLYNALKDEWFDDLGISQKPASYFYNQSEYKNFKTVCELDAEDYLFYRIDTLTIAASKPQKSGGSNNQLRNENAALKQELQTTNSYLKDVLSSTSWKIGSLITWLPGMLKRKIKKH